MRLRSSEVHRCLPKKLLLKALPYKGIHCRQYLDVVMSLGNILLALAKKTIFNS